MFNTELSTMSLDELHQMDKDCDRAIEIATIKKQMIKNKLQILMIDDYSKTNSIDISQVFICEHCEKPDTYHTRKSMRDVPLHFDAFHGGYTCMKTDVHF